MPLEGDGEVWDLIVTSSDERSADLHPDGAHVAFQSNQSNSFEIYVAPYPDGAPPWARISTDGGMTPTWSPDGKELFYRRGNELWAVQIEVVPEVTKGTSVRLFETNFGPPGIVSSWDVMPDGESFVIIRERTHRRRPRPPCAAVR